MCCRCACSRRASARCGSAARPRAAAEIPRPRGQPHHRRPGGRTGDLEGFAEALAESVALDASNREAAAIAAGFFRTHVSSPVDEAELLIALVLADPTDPIAINTLAALLLEYGAFEAATRAFALIEAVMASARAYLEESVIADQVVAMAGAGDLPGAHEVINAQETRARNVELRFMLDEDPDLQLSPLERRAVKGEMAPMLLSLRAALYLLEEDLEAAATAAAEAIQMYDGVASGSTRRSLKAASLATRMRLEQILVIALLGDDDQVARIPDLLAEATSVIALTDSVRSVSIRVHA